MARQLESGNLELQRKRLSMEATYSSLFARDLYFPLQSIFLSLDPVSLKNSRLVCKEWNGFIKGRVWGTKKDSEANSRLRQRLAYHWIHATPTVKSAILQLDNPVQSLSCDDSVVVCGMKDDSAKVYDLVNLNLLAVLDCRPHPDDQLRAGFSNIGNVVADVGRDVVATVTMKGDVSVWRKSDWSPLFKERLHGDNSVTRVKVVANLIITGGYDSRLALLSWNGDQVSFMRMIQEETSLAIPMLNRITGLDSDGEWLLCGTMMKLNVWNLADSQLAHSCDIPRVGYIPRALVWVCSVVLNYPYAVVETNVNEMMMMDLPTGQHVKSIVGYTAHALHHNTSILVGSVQDGVQHSVYFCDLHQITNPQQNGPHWRRRKYVEDGKQVVRSCVNTSCIVAVQGNKLLVWDFWNCDDFNVTPDDFINDVGSSVSVQFSDNLDGLSDSLDDLSENSGEYSDNMADLSDNSGDENDNPDQYNCHQ